MAETVVSSLIDRLVPLLTQEAKLLRGIHGEVADIRYELESIQSFLKDADARAAAEEDMSEGVKTWVKHVREVAFHIDVTIDQYLLHVAVHDPHRRRLNGFLQKTTHLLKSMKSLKVRHKIATEVHEIKASLHKIKERSEKYRFQSTGQGSSRGAWNVSWNDPRKDSLYLEDTDVVGIESSRDELIGWLVEGQPHRIVISVVGMGGLGKTTLAKKIFDHQMVRGHFECYAWISVSQSYSIQEILRSIIKQFREVSKELPLPGIDTMDEQSLVSILRDYLRLKTYVVIFDDVWKIDFWEGIKHALLDNNKGGRIMITTRNREVASFCKKSSHVHVFELQPLTPDEAWELFCKRAFQFEFGGHCPPILEKLSQDIVGKCKGLPLAIVAIGGLLSTKDKTVFEWQNLYDSMGSELGRNPHLTSVDKILSLSYEDLPHYLKSCFLYLGMYPEDYSINCSRLIRQWIAEGFVKELEGKTFEEVAREYLTELIHRSLVQVSDINISGKVRECRLHDILREIILRKMKDLSFCLVLSKQESHFEGLARRISIDGASYLVLKGFGNTHIHSLLFFNLDEFPKSFISTFVANFKLLKVMDFEDALLDCIPEDVGSLFHLRYLSLRNTKVKILPKSIGKLQNLETLDLKQSLVYDVPIEINNLRKLRHFVAYNLDFEKENSLTLGKGVKIQKGVGCLKNLQKLYHVELNHGGVDLTKELGKLRQLRKLGVKNLSKETMMALCASVENMNHLKSLDVTLISEDEIVDLKFISSPPQFLQSLQIKGRLEKFPEWISELQHLVKLRILWSRLNDDPLKVLQNLPNLRQLLISRHAYNGEHFHFKPKGFPKLKWLWIKHLNALHSLLIDEGTLPVLENLSIGHCPELKEVPSGIQHLKKLKQLGFWGMPKEFEENLDPEQGLHYWIVEHVPVILLFRKVRIGYSGYDIHNLHSKHLARLRGQTINQNDDHNKNNSNNINASIEKGKQSSFQLYPNGPLVQIHLDGE